MRTTNRGLTLIELMAAVAISSVVVAAATGIVVTVSQERRENETTMNVRSNANIALSLIQFEALNAGYRFASPAFATRVLNNVAGTELELSSLVNNCGAVNWNVAPGTDVIEFRSGSPGLVPGTASSVSCLPTGTCTVTLGAGSYSNPWAGTADGANDIALFTNGLTSCAGRVLAPGVAAAQMQVQLVGQDLTTVVGSSAYPTCPAAAMTVMRLTSRVRMMICAPPAAQPFARPGLYRQDVLAGTAPQLIQEAIEDLQAIPRVTNSAGIFAGPNCTAGGFCTCNDGVSTCSSIGYYSDAIANGNVLDGVGTATQRAPFALRGMQIGITAVSTRNRIRGNANTDTLVRPAVFDHPAGTVTSGNVRTSEQMGVLFQNIVMVTP